MKPGRLTECVSDKCVSERSDAGLPGQKLSLHSDALRHKDRKWQKKVWFYVTRRNSHCKEKQLKLGEWFYYYLMNDYCKTLLLQSRATTNDPCGWITCFSSKKLQFGFTWLFCMTTHAGRNVILLNAVQYMHLNVW